MHCYSYFAKEFRPRHSWFTQVPAASKWLAHDFAGLLLFRVQVLTHWGGKGTAFVEMCQDYFYWIFCLVFTFLLSFSHLHLLLPDRTLSCILIRKQQARKLGQVGLESLIWGKHGCVNVISGKACDCTLLGGSSEFSDEAFHRIKH